ncbi:hypothetical protein A3H89_05070 [Candidatus Amesbacteria bacterium RIFCSPLOWO2_02_FULL_48_11]|nr:MAG: hypothetical protein A2V48_01865 [Candidatus Amesbacteria bacterium RBG_19FT_COMBO_48_16]OGC99115.1 MAG: hypothetical protein A2W16_01740 [Candidatus Amesbacteria bacterium RBG_16_48_31]OGD02361.1 MAG: hypothetical protein A2354_00890 [Candidatus Amesbacteria bacterium RIFOXYB1_FULL_47_12]OGD06634.1 MAG: hypothetical protein A3H89_05070 [Candidatus Amesbacteria bacterium RIFCSPLOWO2_02_FULL_48_11]
MKRGFTLLELVVVITLIALVSGYVMVNFGRSARVQADKAAGEQLEQALRQAKSNATAGKKEDCNVCPEPPETCAGRGLMCLGADNLCATRDDPGLLGWGVTLDMNGRTVVLDGWCSDGVNNINFTNRPAVKLPGEASLSLSDSLPSGTRVMFKSLGQGMETEPPLAVGSESFTITMADSQVGFLEVIRVFKSGEIQ